jgi:hypothetical protein
MTPVALATGDFFARILRVVLTKGSGKSGLSVSRKSFLNEGLGEFARVIRNKIC